MKTFLSSLASVKDKYTLIETIDGAFTLKLNGVFIHSSRTPLTEASRLLGNIDKSKKNITIYILWGLGMGYHALMLLREGYLVIGVETRPECIEILEKTFPIENLYAFITKDVGASIYEAIASLSPENARLFVDIVMRGYPVDKISLVMEEKAKQALSASNIIYSNLMDSWYVNIIQNLSCIKNDILIKMPKDAFEGQAVVLCSAGPSLRESLPYLSRFRTKYIIIAVDTALRALLEFGIIPDFVHAVDAKILNVRDFASIPDKVFQKMILLADVSLSSIVYEKPWRYIECLFTVQPIKHPKQGFHFKSIFLLEYFISRGLDINSLQTGGSVATSAFHYALERKAEKIYLVGQDLAYSNYRGHSVGTPYDTEYRYMSNRLNTIDTMHIHRLSYISVRGIDGNVLTDPVLNQFRSWFEVSVADGYNEKIADSCINASEAGAYFHGWKHQKFSKLSSSFAHEKDVFVKDPISVKNSKQLVLDSLVLFENIPVDISAGNPLQKEYLYKEYASTLYGNSIDKFLLRRKIKRMGMLIKKIKGACL